MGQAVGYEEKIAAFMAKIQLRNPGELEFIQAVEEVVESVLPYSLKQSDYPYETYKILERLCEPDRVVMFRVCWQDDQGEVHVNRGYRVQFNSAIGPYKGGLRFHPSVSLGTFKFLGFEQIFKNSLTTLPIGAGKGGSDFDPKGRSDHEVMRFCQSFMTELSRHIGSNVDVPAGDIGVGSREIGYLYGQYKRLKNNFTGVLTGKGLDFGGSLIRTEATGYGTVYFMKNMLDHHKQSIEGKVCAISGSGNVAQYTAQKLIRLGAKVVTMSDSSGTIYDQEGLTEEKLAWIIDLKTTLRGRLRDYASATEGVRYIEDQRPWQVAPCDLAFPSATQNELDESDAQVLVKNGCMGVAEGANMPCTPAAVSVFQDNGVLFAPGKAANAGGVAISALEMAQNSMRLRWSRDEVDQKLQKIMADIHQQCVTYGVSDDQPNVDYVSGANIAGFVKVAKTMLAYGVA